MNKKYVWIFSAMFMVSLIAAAWAVSIEGSTTANVVGEAENSILLTIPQININTTDGPDSAEVFSDNFVISKNMTMNVSIDTIFVDMSNGSCSGGESDCSLSYKIINTTNTYTGIFNGFPVFIVGSTEDKNVSIEMTCDAYSCPQTREINISLTQVS